MKVAEALAFCALAALLAGCTVQPAFPVAAVRVPSPVVVAPAPVVVAPAYPLGHPGLGWGHFKHGH